MASQEPLARSMHDPRSLTRRYGGDVRSLLMAGRTFVMQVAHPSVGAGVGAFSAFRTEPWRRLREIEASGRRFTWSGLEAAVAEGERLRRIHRHLKGIDSRGHAYHALDPEVYGWVHFVFFDTMVTMNALYAEPMTLAEQRLLFVEWLEAGRLFGLRDAEMPTSVEAYRERYAHAIENELEFNDVVRDVIGRDDVVPPPPAWAATHDEGWRALWGVIGPASRWLTLAGLPPRYRDKLPPELAWTDADERRLHRLGALLRATVPRLPPRLRLVPYAYAARRAQGDIMTTQGS